MPLDNDMYDRLSHTWWEDGSFLNFLKAGLNPVRFGYMRRVLTESAGLDPRQLSVLDVGCGGGLLAEEFARLGCRVTGVDPSGKSIEEARRHAATAELAIDYRTGRAEQLPTDNGVFDVVYCCDVLEHVDDVSRSIIEIARSLRPGGLFLYDTINRTWRSWILLIKIAQDWRLTRWAEPNLHEWGHFIRPRELDVHLRNAHLQPVDRIGISPRNPVTATRGFIDHARGRIDHAELGRRLALIESRDTSSSYAGWAVKSL